MNRHVTSAGVVQLDIGQGNVAYPHYTLWNELRALGPVTLLQGAAYQSSQALVDFLPPEPLDLSAFDASADAVTAMGGARVTFGNMPRGTFGERLRDMAWRAFRVWLSALGRCSHKSAVDRSGAMPADARALRETNLRIWQDQTLADYRRIRDEMVPALADYRARWAAGPGAASNAFASDPLVEPYARWFESADAALERLVATHVGVVA